VDSSNFILYTYKTFIILALQGISFFCLFWTMGDKPNHFRRYIIPIVSIVIISAGRGNKGGRKKTREQDEIAGLVNDWLMIKSCAALMPDIIGKVIDL